MLFFKLTVGLSESMMHAILWELWRLHTRRCFNKAWGLSPRHGEIPKPISATKGHRKVSLEGVCII